jgi:dUTP pyrophosphatase
MTDPVEVKIKKLDPLATMPEYAHPGDAAFDVFALKDTIVPARGRAVISTGFAMEFPAGYVALVWDKSGPPAKFGLTTMAGVVDSSYRGEIKIIMYNTEDQDYTFKAGEKVAQVLIQPVERVTITEVSELSDTARGAGGFGSTGTRKSSS